MDTHTQGLTGDVLSTTDYSCLANKMIIIPGQKNQYVDIMIYSSTGSLETVLAILRNSLNLTFYRSLMLHYTLFEPFSVIKSTVYYFTCLFVCFFTIIT